MATREEFKEIVKELVKEEVARLMGENQPSVFRKVLAAAPEIAEDEEEKAKSLKICYRALVAIKRDYVRKVVNL